MKRDQDAQTGHEAAGIPGVATYVWDTATQRVYWTPEMLRLYGLSQAPETEDGFVELVHPDDRLGVEAAIDRVLTAGESFCHEFRIVRPDGSVRIVHDKGVVERDGNGLAVRVRGLNVDVTPARRVPRDDVLELALTAADLGIWQYDFETGLPTWDATTYRLFDQPHGVPLSVDRVVSEMIHPEDRQQVLRILDAAQDPAGPGEYFVEHRVRTRDGSERWLAVSGRVFFDDDGRDGARRAVRMVGTARDVTARRLSSRALRDSRDLVKLALEAGGMGTWRTDFESGVAEVDETTRALFFVAADGPEIPLDAFYARMHPDDLPAMREAWADARPGQRVRLEFRVIAPDGTERWLLGVGEKREMPDGRVVASGVNLDVTAQKRDEMRIRESEARFREMADNLPLIVWMHDAEGNQEFVNRTFCDYFGVSREEMRAKRWQVLMHPEDADAYVAEFARCIRERCDFHAEVRVCNGSGEWRWLESWGAPRFDAAGGYAGHVGTSADVTERKENEKMRRLLAEELNHRVKNTLAIVQSMANQSMRPGLSPEEGRATFAGRLRALAAAHDSLIREDWQRSTLRRVVEDARDSVGVPEERVRIEGPRVALAAKEAVAMTLGLHELFTNAIKHGALSVNRPRAGVSVTWTVSAQAEPELRVEWAETGGPDVAPPERKGFGSQLVRQALAAELGAEVALEFPRAGVRCTIVMPRPPA
jgi:PAS domain S-box-containing protein